MSGAAWAKSASNRNSDSDEKGRRRTFNALTRLGYGYSDIRSAMRSVDEEYEDTDDQFSC